MVTSTSRKDMKEAIIIGVDFGTTFSGVAWCYTGDPKTIRKVKAWPGNDNMVKVPSVIQYGSKDSSRYKWGFEVALEAPNSLQWFKLLLNEQSAGTAVSRPVPPMPQRLSETHRGDADQLARLLKTIASLPADKTPLAVVTDYLKGIYQHARDALEKAYPTSFSSSIGKDIALEFCLTVPAIWNDTAKDLTLQAARAAGMSESHVKIKTVSEPEAAAIHCLKTFHETEDCLKVGDVYVIADCGGGTVDLISYEIKTIEPRLQVDECVAGTGGLCGSTALNRRFEALVKERLGTTEWEKMGTVARFNTMRHFDTFLKPEFCPSETPDLDDDEFDVESFYCPVPGVPNDPGKGIHRGQLVLTTEEMTGIFEPTFVEITSLVQQQITAAETKTGAPITGVLLVGGFGSSPYLFKYLSTKLKRSDGIPVKVLQPPDAWISIALGAVQYGLSMRQVREGILPSGSGIVGSRIARFSYGVSAGEPFIPGLHPSNKMYYSPLTGGFWCRGRMQWFVKKNERILDGKDIEVELVKHCPTGVEPDQLVFPQEILSCDLEEPPRDAESTDVRHLLIFTADLGGVSRRKHFIRKKAAHEQSAYFAIPLSMLMRYESGCLGFSMAVGGKAVGKGSVNYDHETPQSVSRLDD
ncbi:hypothetical protein BGX38DRAFT_1142745 [Terfezia claveryi]|nr:hypothetical protein BGX38DRAFT_1142745 [Terfezia claveryi]